MNASRPGIEKLEWDSAFFGFGVGRVLTERLTSEDAARCAEDARLQNLKCIYYLAGAGDSESWRAAIGAGFDPVDLRVELDWTLSTSAEKCADCAQAVREDLPSLLVLARGAFVQSRFFCDKRFPATKAEELFNIWVERGVSHSGEFAIVCRPEGEPAGFVSGRIESGDSGRIELVAVSSAFRGLGVGRRLLASAAAEFERRGANRITVVTQGSNIAAQRLYQSAGFQTRTVGVWFHGWF